MNAGPVKGSIPRISAWVGVVAPVVFILTFLLDGLLTPGYSLIDRPISDLALTGTYGWVQDVNFAMLGIFLFIFALGFPSLIGTTRHGRLGLACSMLLAVSGAGYVLVAVFPAQSPGESPYLLHVLMHSIGFTTIFLSFGVALLLANIVLRDFGGSWRRFAWYSIATAIFPIIAALGNLSTIGAIASGFETTHGAGLITEVLVVVALAWYIILSYRVLRQGRKG